MDFESLMSQTTSTENNHSEKICEKCHARPATIGNVCDKCLREAGGGELTGKDLEGGKGKHKIKRNKRSERDLR